MTAKTETKLIVNLVETPLDIENPMQERHCGEVAESSEVTAEDILTERKREFREESGPVFVP